MTGSREPGTGASGWAEAARLFMRWLAEGERVDALMEGARGLDPVERARCQQLVFAGVRHAGRIEAGLRGSSAHPPRFIVRAVLYLIGAEMIEAGPGLAARAAPIVHHAVERVKSLASVPESRLVNAVGRKLGVFLLGLQPPAPGAADEAFAEYYSHPEWLVRRWRAGFGEAGLRALLEWNQQPGKVFVRWRSAGDPPPVWLKPTRWADYYELEGGAWPQVEAGLKEGRLYIQDPGTRLAVDLLNPKPGETWFDACAAPGGKSVLIADRAGTGRLIAADSDRERQVRLRENLALVRGVQAELAVLDLLSDPAAALKRAGLPVRFDAVLVDAPCTNTGVMRHRVDVKWRLQEEDFRRHARQQQALLEGATPLVGPGGRLVYSTCSIDGEENRNIANIFLARHPEFRLEGEVVALPWEAGHDGAGVFRFRRV